MEICGKEIRTRGRIIRVAFLDGEGYQFLEDPEAALAAFRNCGPRVDLFTFIQRLADTTPKYDYPTEHDNFAVLPITTFERWWNDQIGFKARNKAKQAERKGVVIKEVPFDDTLIQGISAIYNESPVRQGRRFLHYGEDLETVGKISTTFLDRSTFIGAFFEGKLIGFAKLVSDEDRSQAGLMHILSMIRHRDKAPTNALIAQAVRSCAEREIPYLWYANFSYGRRQTDTLVEFKRRTGFQKVEIPRYYVPLTLAGRGALSLGLHHTALDWIPEPAAAAYRRLRKVWYENRFPGPEGA